MDRVFVVLLGLLPAWVLIGIGVVVAIVVIVAIIAKIADHAEASRLERERQRAAAAKRDEANSELERKQEVERRAARLAAARREREELTRMEERGRIETFGKNGAALVKLATISVTRTLATEAARDGWLGSVDFASDIAELEENLRQAQALRAKSVELASLPSRTDGDRQILAHAKAAITQLERRTKQHASLLYKCAQEAEQIDQSLRKEREHNRVSAKREVLHGELAAMLYGVDAAAEAPATDSGADAVMARVRAYQEIKGELDRARVDPESSNRDARVDDVETPPPSTENPPSHDWIPTPVLQAWKWIVE